MLSTSKRSFHCVSVSSVYVVAMALIAMVLGVLWYPISWYLADNFSGSFGGGGDFRGSARAGEYYWHYTYAVVGYPLILLAFHLVLKLFRK